VTSTTLGYAFIGGLLPAFIWLYLILKEDASHPEPRSLIALTFIVGMVAILPAASLQDYAKEHLTSDFSIYTAWALIEEVLKYAVVAALILWRNAVDEAPDYVIYMITAALGFAAAENMLFIFSSFSNGGFIDGFSTGNVRFLGSSLLHVVASATIGFALAFSTRLRPNWRLVAAALGLILATALHTAFNMLIMNKDTTLAALFLVWTTAVVFFAAFEVLKYFQYRNLSNNT